MHAQRLSPRRDRGQILVLFAGGLFALIAIVGLAIDGGNVFVARRDSQNASDIASLAGTKRLHDWYVKSSAYTATDNIYTVVRDSLQANGCVAADGCAWTARYVGGRVGSTFPDLGAVAVTDSAPPGAVAGSPAMGVRVDIHTAPRTFFLGILGKGAWDVNTTAISQTFRITTVPPSQLLPIALVDGQQMNPGTIYSLTSGANGPGNFGWISWSGSNTANALATSICTPDNPEFTLPYEFAGDPGKTNADAVRACLEQWVQSGQTILIPVVYAQGDPAAPAGCSTGPDGGNNWTFCIKSVVSFTVTGYSQPAVDQINGRFDSTISYSVGQTVPGGGLPPAPGGTNGIGLAK